MTSLNQSHILITILLSTVFFIVSPSLNAQNDINTRNDQSIQIDEQFFLFDTFLISIDSLKLVLNHSKQDSILLSSDNYFYLNNDALYARKNLLLDFESNSQFTFIIQVLKKGNLNQDTLIIDVVDVDEPPIFSKFEPIDFVDENPTKPVYLGRFLAIDPDSIGIIEYSLTLENTKSLDFKLIDDSLFIDEPLLFNYERNSSISFNLMASELSNSSSKNFTVNLVDIPEAPTALQFSTNNIQENIPNNTVIDTIYVIDEDKNDIIELYTNTELVDLNRIESNIFSVSILDSSFFDHEKNQNLTISYKAVDQFDLYIEHDITYNILNINEKPYLLIDSTITTKEDLMAEIFFNASDPETPSNQLHYQLKSSNPFLLREIDYDLKRTDSTAYQLIINPVKNAFGEADLNFVVSDEALSDSVQIKFIVQAVNDLPSVSLSEIIILESETYLIDRQDIIISDIDNLPTEITLIIEGLPAHGSLFFGDSLIAETNFQFNYLDLIKGNLAYRHDGNENLADSIDFSFFDLEGQKQAFTLPITIKPVNDAPYFATNFFPIYLSESDSADFRFIVNDVDNLPTELQIKVKSLNPEILRDENIKIQGIDFYRTLHIKSSKDKFGEAKLEILVSDGDKATTKLLPVIIKPINDAPSMVASVKNLSLKVNTTSSFNIDYFDSDSEFEALALSIGSTNNRVISDDNIKTKHDTKNAKYIVEVTTKEDIIGDGLLIIELADESKASALQIPFEVNYGNRQPRDFQLLAAEPILKNDSLVVDFSWTPSLDPDGDKVTYSIFIKSDKEDTVIHNVQTNEFTFKNRGFLSPISNYSWFVKATDNGSQSNKRNYIDSTQSIDLGSFVTPNFSKTRDWVEIQTIYPNPFNFLTKISYVIQNDAQVEVAIYDLSGRKVDVILDDIVSKGTYDLRWQPQNATSGLYICRVSAKRLIDGETLRVSKSVTYLPN